MDVKSKVWRYGVCDWEWGLRVLCGGCECCLRVEVEGGCLRVDGCYLGLVSVEGGVLGWGGMLG